MVSSRQIRDWLVEALRPDRWTLLIAVVCSAGVAVASLSVAWLMKPFVNATSATGSHVRLTSSQLHHIDWISLGLVGIYVVRGLFSYGQTVSFNEVSLRLGLRLRNQIYQHLQGLSLAYFNRQRTGALMSTMNNDVPAVQSAVTGLKDVATAPFLIVGGLVTALKMSILLTCAAVLVVPIMAMSISLLTRRIRSITGQTQGKLSEVNTLMEETLSGIRIIQSFSAEKVAIKRFRRENQNAKDLSMSVVRQSARLRPLTDVIGAAGVAGALWLAGHQVVQGHLTLGSLATFIFALNQVAIGVSSLGAVKVTWEQICGAGAHIFENVLSMDSDVEEIANPVVLSSAISDIEFRDVRFSYNSETPVLSGITFKMSPGEVVAVVGKTGAGKSTIADLIPRFYDPDSGSILIDGHDLRNVQIESLRKQIGIVPQETILFGGTIRENITLGNPDATDEMIVKAAEAANAHEFINDPRVLPDGYNTVVGERGKQLSGGQRQRIAIARALLKDPRILILDEATSSLDASSELLVQEALDELMQHRTTLVIAHRLSTIVNANKILVIDAGKIVECGSHNDLIKIPNGIYSRLYETHFRWEEEPKAPDVAGASL